MRLISFDVGLRNLSYCILEGSSRRDLRITGWDLIDVMAEIGGHDKPLCYKCKKPACWQKSGDQAYSCSRHRGQNGGVTTKSELGKKSKEELQALALQYGIPGRLKKELVDGLFKSLSAGVWKRCVKSAKQCSVVDLAPAIHQSLSSRKELWKDANLVVFEQQPDKRMLCVQGMLQMWFTTQGYRCKGVSAVHKLTNTVTLEDATKTYKGRKKTGIVHTLELAPKEWHSFFMKHHKKDDLGDAFLGGLYVLEHISKF